MTNLKLYKDWIWRFWVPASHSKWFPTHDTGLLLCFTLYLFTKIFHISFILWIGPKSMLPFDPVFYYITVVLVEWEWMWTDLKQHMFRIVPTSPGFSVTYNTNFKWALNLRWFSSAFMYFICVDLSSPVGFMTSLTINTRERHSYIMCLVMVLSLVMHTYCVACGT